MMAFSIHLNDEERKLADSYAALHGISLSEAFKKALFEKIEDEYDVAIVEEVYDENAKSGKKSELLSKLWQELDL